MVNNRALNVFCRCSCRCAVSTIIVILLLRVPPLAAYGGRQDAPAVVYRNTAPGVGYVGSQVCGGCHAAIYQSYLKTDMGRSMSLPSDSTELARIPSRITIQDPKLNRYFETFREGSEIFQSEYELAPNGTEV